MVNALSFLPNLFISALTFFHCKSHHSVSLVIEVQQRPEESTFISCASDLGLFLPLFIAVINASIRKQANFTLSYDVMCSISLISLLWLPLT